MEMLKVGALLAEWPSGLKSAGEIGQDLGLEPERLLDLASAGFCPHYRIDGATIRFRLPEVRKWAAKNILQQVSGTDLPEPIRIVVHPQTIANFRRVPECIREVENLKDITDEIRRIGIYFLCEEGRLLYVGQSVNAASRVASHIVNGKKFCEVFFLPWPREDLDRLEGALIRTLKPEMNGRTGPRPSEDADAAIVAQAGLDPAIASSVNQ